MINYAQALYDDFISSTGLESGMGHLGFKVGDIRGGVSISIPLTPYFEADRESKQSLLISHGGVWLTGMLIIGFASFKERDQYLIHREADRALRDSEKQFRGMFDNVGVGVAKTTPDGKFLLVNDRLVNILGRDRDELMSLSFADITHPEDRDIYVAAIKELLSGHRHNYVTEKQYIRPDGSTIWAFLIAEAVRDDDGTVQYLLSIVDDISDRKQAEETAKTSEDRLAEIFAIAPEAIITIGEDMGIQLFNKGAERIFGYNAKEVLGRSMEILMPERLRHGHHKHIEGFYHSPDTYRLMDQREEILGLRKDGTEFPASASVSKLETSGEKIFTVMLQDITERQVADKERRIALFEAEKANQAKSDFLASMSHELRTPLNAIIGFSEMLTNQMFGAHSSPKYLEYAGDIHSSSSYLLGMINDILDLSAIEAGKHTLIKESLIVNDVIEECSLIIASSAAKKDITYSVEAPVNSVPLYADLRAMKQILINVLSNAVKFTPPGRKITLKVTASAAHHVFEVSDTGDGIPAEKHADLTEAFIRGETDPHKAQEGTGLGLAIVKSLVELHGGELTIKSKIDEGTTVSVKIPNGEP